MNPDIRNLTILRVANGWMVHPPGEIVRESFVFNSAAALGLAINQWASAQAIKALDPIDHDATDALDANALTPVPAHFRRAKRSRKNGVAVQ